MKIHIQYFASLADMRGVEEENLDCADNITAENLYTQLKKKYNFTFETANIRVAINHEYKDFSTALKENDTVVFISPVSGG